MKRKLLYEVSIIRPLVILLLVIMHSFTMYAGGWLLPDGIGEVNAYSIGVKLITGFRIEMIALVSGYVFAYQSIKLDRHYDFKSFAYKKFIRLIIPCLIFSLIYYFCFQFNRPAIGSMRWFVALSSGFGHLWFLPMLFWCFLIIWAIDHYRLSSKVLFVALAISSLIPVPNLPFSLSRVFHFSFYCYLGYILYTNKERLLKRFMSVRNIVFMWAIYFILVVFSNIIFSPENIYIRNILALFTACSGIMALYLLVCKCIGKPGFQPQEWVIKSSSVCYGVYVYHEFILKFMYYHTPLPQILGTYMLPWFGCLVAIVFSLLLTNLSLKTKAGRFLIG